MGRNHPDYASALLLLGSVYRTKADYKAAAPLFNEALAVYERAYGPNDLNVARALLNIGVVADATGNSARALAAYQRVLAIHERVYGSESPQLEPALDTLESYYVKRKQYAAAEPLYLKGLAIQSKAHGPTSDGATQVLVQLATLRELAQDLEGQRTYLVRALSNIEAAHGKTSTQVAAMLTRLGLNARARNDFKSGIAAYERALAIYEAPATADISAAALCLNNLARFHGESGDYVRARPLYERAIQYDERGGDQRGVAVNLASLATLAADLGDTVRARELFQRALTKLQVLQGPEGPDVGAVLGGLASTYSDAGDYAKAQSLCEQRLSLAEKSGDIGERVQALNSLAAVEDDRGAFARAIGKFRQALGLLEGAGQVESIDGAMVLGNLGSSYQSNGDYKSARTVYERALGISERVHAPDDPDRAHVWNNLGDLSKELGDYPSAEKQYRQGYEIWTRAFGQQHPLVATALNNLGTLSVAKGDYARAKSYLERALAVVKKARPAGHPEIATTSNNLATLCEDQGDWERAEALHEEALAGLSKSFDERHPLVTLSLNNLGAFYLRRGDSRRAAPLLQRALRGAELRQDRRAIAKTSANLAAMYDAANDLPHAETLWRQALSLLEADVGPSHPELGPALLGLSSVLVPKEQFAEAERLTRRALELAVHAEGSKGPNVARVRGSLAFILGEKRDYRVALPLFGEAARGLRENFGDAHPDLATALISQGLLQWEAGDRPGAVRTLAEGFGVRERGLVRLMSTGSEEQRRLVSGTSAGDLNWAVSFHAQGFPRDAAARRQALLAVLQRKGRVLDAVTETTRTLRQHLDLEARTLFDQLRTKRTEIANRSQALTHPGPAAEAERQALRSLEQEAEITETALAKRSSLFAARAAPISVGRVASAIPENSALIEIVSYLPFDPKARATRGWGAPRYAAYVLRRDESVAYADLGDGKSLDERAAAFRRVLANPKSDPETAAKDLDQRLLQPLRPLLRGARHLIFAPDGALSVIPFGALMDAHGHYLLENGTVSYVSTGRELLRPTPVAARTRPLVVANPDFGPLPRSKAANGNELLFEALAGTEQEGRALTSSVTGARLLTGAGATTHAVEAVEGPRLLHLATHGFFLDDTPNPSPLTRGFFVARRAAPPAQQNPLLRSGLAFAGANLRRPNDDGLLSALEASSLNLWGTQLVVLSACDTGLGVVRTGEGVYGLRRAFTLAGAESLVMSLWSVQDAATRDLMIRFYQYLARGDGRAEALRKTQLEMLKNRSVAHPYFWASFVAYGQSGPLWH